MLKIRWIDPIIEKILYDTIRHQEHYFQCKHNHSQQLNMKVLTFSVLQKCFMVSKNLYKNCLLLLDWSTFCTCKRKISNFIRFSMTILQNTPTQRQWLWQLICYIMCHLNFEEKLQGNITYTLQLNVYIKTTQVS